MSMTYILHTFAQIGAFGVQALLSARVVALALIDVRAVERVGRIGAEAVPTMAIISILDIRTQMLASPVVPSRMTCFPVVLGTSNLVRGIAAIWKNSGILNPIRKTK